MSRKRQPADKRFWARVDKRSPDDCWCWDGGKEKYGYFYYEGRRQMAHRVSYMLNIGPIPEGLDILHKCDNPRCVNPAHLWPGTHTQNMQDKTLKRRNNSPTGERHPKAKLTVEQVIEVRRLAAEGVSQREIGAMFGISQVAVWHIKHKINWPDKALAAPRK